MSMISNVVERLEVDSFTGSYFTHSSKIVFRNWKADFFFFFLIYSCLYHMHAPFDALKSLWTVVWRSSLYSFQVGYITCWNLSYIKTYDDCHCYNIFLMIFMIYEFSIAYLFQKSLFLFSTPSINNASSTLICLIHFTGFFKDLKQIKQPSQR